MGNLLHNIIYIVLWVYVFKVCYTKLFNNMCLVAKVLLSVILPGIIVSMFLWFTSFFVELLFFVIVCILIYQLYLYVKKRV